MVFLDDATLAQVRVACSVFRETTATALGVLEETWLMSALHGREHRAGGLSCLSVQSWKQILSGPLHPQLLLELVRSNESLSDHT